MVSYEQFASLRLAQFLSLDDREEISETDDFEFMDCYWIGEEWGFTNVLQLESDPEVTRCMSLDLNDLSGEDATRIFVAINLPLRPFMTVGEICDALKTQPVDERSFVADRKSYDFTIDAPDRYDISCTVLNKGGLIYCVVMRADYRMT